MKIGYRPKSGKSVRAYFLAACAGVAGTITASSAAADPFSPPVVTLAPTTVFISPAGTFDIYTAPGVYHNASVDSALFGADPSVSSQYYGDDGATQAELTYQIELLGPGTPPLNPTTYPSVAVGITMADIVNVPANDLYAPRADAQIVISGGPTSPLDMENCAGNVFTGCSYGGQGFTTTPIGSITQVNLIPFVVYTVDLRVDTEEAGFAELDPTFTAPDGYTMAYSDGVGPSAVPEPTTWALMVLGIGGLGFMLRRDRARANMTAI